MTAAQDPPTLEGQVCLVTGATSGIGRFTATALAAKGVTVIIAGRNPAKAAEAVQSIQADTGNQASSNTRHLCFAGVKRELDSYDLSRAICCGLFLFLPWRESYIGAPYLTLLFASRIIMAWDGNVWGHLLSSRASRWASV